MMCSFDVRGMPMPKGSFTRMPHGGMIPAGTADSRRRMGQWRDDVRFAAENAMGLQRPFEGGIRLFVEFAMPVPKTMPKYKIGWLPHTKQPDADKLLRMLSDALTGICWLDDSQVCVLAVNKVYAWNGRTGATVTVDEITDDEARAVAEQRRRIGSQLAASTEE